VTAQVHSQDNAWHLCHTSCKLLDAGTLRNWLSEIKTWLDNNPNEGAQNHWIKTALVQNSLIIFHLVITVLLVNSDNASAEDLHAEFEAADIVKYAYTPTSQTTPPETWPTLQELISNGTRMMTFVASLSASSNTVAPYLMDEFTFIFENPYDVTSPSNFSCQPDRPSSVKGNIESALSSNRLPFMNHFLYQSEALGIEIPNVDRIKTTNAPSGGTGNLGDAAAKCKSAWGRQPTFILVDFFDQGPAIETVDSLNGVSDPVGRKAVPDTNSEAQTSAGSTTSNVFKGLVDLVNSVKDGANPSLGNWIWVGGNWGSLLGGGIDL